MAGSILDDLQYVQLMVKENHRRKRALEKLNKTKKHKNIWKYAKYEEWHQKKYNKYFIEYEIKSIYNNNDILIDIEDDIITTTTTTTTATVIINDNINNNTYKKIEQKDEKHKQKLTLQHTNNDTNDNDENDENEENDNDDNDDNEISLSSFFEAIEYDLFNKQKMKQLHMIFPTQFVCQLTSLYETKIKKDISGLLNSARYWNINSNDRHKGMEGQAVVIGSYFHELINILSNIIIDCPIDIIYIISELVGNAIIWFRKTGLSVFKWSAKNTTKLKFEYHNVDDNEFYFSGYIDCKCSNKLKELLNENCTNQYCDLDWCFIVFLLLGLIPMVDFHQFRWYFNQKLLSYIPGSYPLKFNV